MNTNKTSRKALFPYLVLALAAAALVASSICFVAVADQRQREEEIQSAHAAVVQLESVSRI